MFNKLFFVLYSSLLISLVPMGAAAQETSKRAPGSHSPLGMVGFAVGNVDPVAIKRLRKYKRSIQRHQKAEQTRRARTRVIHIHMRMKHQKMRAYIQNEKIKIKDGAVSGKAARDIPVTPPNSTISEDRPNMNKRKTKKPQSTIKYITKNGNINTLYCRKSPCTPGSLALHGATSGKDMGIPLKRIAKLLQKKIAPVVIDDSQINKNSAINKPDIKKEMSAALRPKTLEKLDRLFENPMADLAGTNDINLARALSIPKSQVEKNKEAYKDSVKNSHKNKEAETDYVKNADEIKQYCLYEGC